MSMVDIATGHTFTVGELKAMLKDEEDDDLVYLYCASTGRTLCLTSGSYGVYLNGVKQEKGYAELIATEPFPPAKINPCQHTANCKCRVEEEKSSTRKNSAKADKPGMSPIQPREGNAK